MIVPLLLALLLPILAASAGEAPAADSPLAVQAADPALLGLERDLASKLNDKKEGSLKLEEYQAWESGFRARLATSMEEVSHTPDNQAAHARIQALLGDRKEARAALDQALDGNPDNPTLLRAKGRLLFEQKDYAGAADHGMRAYENSGRTDTDALALYHTAKDRVAPTGADASARPASPTPSGNATAGSVDDPSMPFKLAVKGKATPGDVPFVATDAAPAAPASRGPGLLTLMAVGTGVLLIAWGAVPAETKERFKQVLWEYPKQQMKAMAAITAIAVVAYGGYLVLPSILGAAAPTGAAMTPALAGGGATGGGIVLQQAAAGTAKAAILTGGAYVVGRGTLDNVSYAKSKSGDDKGSNERIDWDKPGRQGDKEAYNRVTVNDGTKNNLAEIDHVDLRNNKFLESKTGTGLDRINPGTGKVQQTHQQWAKEQIFDDAEKLIHSLRQAKGTGYNGLTKDAPPNIARLREIRNLEYRIQSQDSRIIKAVGEELARLRIRFPDWTFSALFGGL